MSYLDVLRISWKNLTANKMRTLLTVLGISVGISTIVFLVSLGYGLQELSVRKIGSIASITALDVTPAQSSVSLNEKSLEDFSKIPNVESVSPLISLTGKVAYSDSQSDAVIYGINEDYFSLQGLAIKPGGGIFTGEDKAIVISSTVAKTMNIDEGELLGKNINLISYFPKSDSGDLDRQELSYKIVGVIDDSGSPFLYLPLKTIKSFLNDKTTYNSAKVKINSTENIVEAKTVIESRGFKASSIADTIDQVYKFFVYIRIGLASFGAIALIVASIGMFNTMTIALLERMRDIGIMKAVGVQNGTVRKMFLTESFLIAFLGGVFGIIFGIVTGFGLNLVINLLAMSVGGKPETLFATPIDIFLIIFAFSLLVGIMTGFYPAKRASNLNPLDALRYE